MNLSKQLSKKLNEVRGEDDDTYWKISVEGLAVDPSFIYNRAGSALKSAQKIFADAGFKDFSLTQLGKEDITVVIEGDSYREGIMLSAKKLADALRSSTSSEFIRKNRGVVVIRCYTPEDNEIQALR